MQGIDELLQALPGQAGLIRGTLVPSLKENLQVFQSLLGGNADLVMRRFQVGSLKFGLVFLDGMVDKTMLQEEAIKPLLALGPAPEDGESPEHVFNQVKDEALPMSEVTTTRLLEEALVAVLSGDAALLMEGAGVAMVLDVRGWKERNVSEPEGEFVTRGPREGFNENLKSNMALLRRRIRDPNLKLRKSEIGQRSKTDVVLAYLEGVASALIIDEVKGRLDTIDLDGVMDSGYIEQMIEDEWIRVFPTVQSTERPDKAAAAILEGRVVVLVDNSPFALIVPATFNDFFHSPDDWYVGWVPATAIRVIRFIGSVLALTLPGLYIALTSFHPEMIPTTLLFSIITARQGIPFPAFAEAFIMEGALELLREAGIRLPGPVGQSVTVVGGIIIGEMAVRASIVSPIMVIVVAITAIASFALPALSVALSLRLLRFALMVMGALFGLYGFVIGLLLILTRLTSLKSFGVPYLVPYAPASPAVLKDTVLRQPLAARRSRSAFLKPGDPDRQDDLGRDWPARGDLRER